MAVHRLFLVENFLGQDLAQRVSRLDGLLIAKTGRTVNPHEGLQVVFLDTLAAVIKKTKVVLGEGMVLFSRHAEPVSSL